MKQKWMQQRLKRWIWSWTLKAEILPEPDLEFAGGVRHPDVRFGLMDYGPFDSGHSLAPQQIRLGLVGTSAMIEKFRAFVDDIRNGVDAKPSRQPTLFPSFPGLGGAPGRLKVDIVLDPAIERRLGAARIAAVTEKSLPHERLIEAGAQLFAGEISDLAERGKADVVVCLPSGELIAAMDASAPGPAEIRADFHDIIKARAMECGSATQILLPSSYDGTSSHRRSRIAAAPRRLQDDATRAWNLYTALYYKANGIPWRIAKESGEYDTCYVGVSFYRTRDRMSVHSSVAQVFNERGEGVVVRGAAAEISKEDRQPHLERLDAMELLLRAVSAYRKEHGHAPARVVVHKSSRFSDAEREGFIKALASERIDLYDLVWIRDSNIKLLRNGKYPVLRGTFVSLARDVHVLYTRGSVDFYRTYPGMYVPRALEFQCFSAESAPRRIAEEIMALTKMNWNNTQFDGGYPITLVASRRVGNVLRYVPSGARIAPRYSFYM